MRRGGRTVTAIGALLALLPLRAADAQPIASPSALATARTAAPAHHAAPGTAALFIATATDPRYPGSRTAAEIARTREFAADVVGWVALGRVLWSSGYDQVVGSPTVWERSGEGYGRRFVTRSAQLVAIEGTRHGLAAALGRDPAYVPCACEAFWSRVGHVTLGTLTDFDVDGQRRAGWPRFAGALAGALVLGQLQPGQGKASTVALRAVTTVGASWLGNAAKEFGVMPGAKRGAVDGPTP